MICWWGGENFMKKLLCMLVMVLSLQSIGVLATENVEPVEDVTNVEQTDLTIEGNETNGESTDDINYDDAVYLNNYEDIENAFQAVDENALYREAFEQQLLNNAKLYSDDIRYETIKAKIISGDKEEVYYTMDGYYQIYRIKYQPITVEILEGNLKGKTYDTNYVLSVDDYDNINVSPVPINTVINVVVSGDAEDKVQIYVTTVDAGIARFHWVVVLLVIAVVLIAVFLGKTGLKVLPMLILIFDLLFIIFVPEMFNGRGIWWLTVISMIAYLIVENAIKLGLNFKALASMISTIAVVVITTGLLQLLNQLMGLSGITLELANIAQSYPLGKFDFYQFHLSLYTWMAFVVVSNISCQTVRVYTENNSEEAKKKIQKYVSGMLPIVMIMTLGMSAQKCLYLCVTKYTVIEFINSEMMLNELLRGIFLIIAMTATTGVAQITQTLLVQKEEKQEEEKPKAVDSKKEESVNEKSLKEASKEEDKEDTKKEKSDKEEKKEKEEAAEKEQPKEEEKPTEEKD